MIKRYKDYVCPCCWEKITKCKCKYQPWQLVMIDEPIQGAIKALNNNGFTTKFCCSGHYHGPNNITEIQVMFCESLKKSPPANWRINYNNSNIFYTFSPANKEDFDAIQKTEIEKLTAWANEGRGE